MLLPAAYPRAAFHDRPLVWVASYPKSGNTWTRILLGNLLGDPREEESIATIGNISASRPLFDDATGLASSDLTADEIDLLRPESYRVLAGQSDGPCFIKAHDACQRNSAGEWIFPPDCSRGAVLLVRHPMDVALSFAHHMGHGDLAIAVARLGNASHMMAGEGHRQYHQRTLGWSGHYLSWTRQDAIPLLVVRYEDMLADTAAEFGRIVRFLGLPHAEDEARIARAVELSRFDRLRSIEQRDGFREVPARADRFFRSGRAGEGIERLPDHLRAKILDTHGPVMEELGYSQHGAEPL